MTTTQLSAIDFTADIAKLTENFTGRQWILDELDRWLKESGERFFLLTGEPGIGKSAISAQLIKTRKDIIAYHFCIARRGGTIEPNNVLLSLAAQLIENLPQYAEALVNIIKPLKLSVNVDITVQNIKNSDIRGVIINNLHTQNPQEALNIILRQTLVALKHSPEQFQIILIDSLDEAITYSDRDNLVTLLAGLNDLPSWVKILLTSRPENRVIREFGSLKPRQIEELSPQNLSDVREYLQEQLKRASFKEILRGANITAHSLIDEIAKFSNGNFLYTKILLKDIETGEQSINDPAALPKSLDEIYLSFLNRFKPKEWDSQYQPILGILTAVQEPITEDELVNFTSISSGTLRRNLGVIRQFLDVGENNSGDDVYTLFHQSLRDYLVNKKRNESFWCDPVEQHENIINYYKVGDSNWNQSNINEIDNYGLRYLVTHIVEVANITRGLSKHLHTKSLVELVANVEFQQCHQAKLQDLVALQRDIEKSLRHVSVSHSSSSIALMVEMSLASVAFKKMWLSPEPIFELAKQGDIAEAENRLNLFTLEQEWYQVAILTISWLASELNFNDAQGLKTRVSTSLLAEAPFPLLLKRLNAKLEKRPVQSLIDVPVDAPSAEYVQAILMRMGGVQDEELLSKFGLQPLTNPSFRIEVLDTDNGGENRPISYVSEQDGPLLVAYAIKNPADGGEYIQQYLDILSNYQYQEYRNRSLMAMLKSILQHPDQQWVEHFLPILVCKALFSANHEFQSGLPLTLAGLRGLFADLQEIHESLESTIANMPGESSKGDNLFSQFLEGDAYAEKKNVYQELVRKDIYTENRIVNIDKF
jgi:hypothetical protein